MQLNRALIIVFGMLSATLAAQNVYDVYPERVGGQTAALSEVRSQTNGEEAKGRKSRVESQKSDEEKIESNGVLTGFTGGMKVHVGYAFAQSPDELFRNASLKDIVKLPADGVTMGLGGELRVHLFRHLHIGAEGGMSIMPLTQSGSSVRTGWGGVLCDYYAQIGKAKLMIGTTIGGGVNKRLYVPEDKQTVQSSEDVTYNASYTHTPFFMLDPYVGTEFKLSKRMSLLVEIDYMLPFGDGGKGLNTETVRWSNFLSPSGPRLYVGLLFGRHDFR